ncbi:hypothetical protein HN415_08995 [Candidatus Woesearchaeota archaeon]|jgi:hypothetical protein|nr:hypothetical protein [Candidatus Woesearchaeota archaeon]
MKSNNNLIMRKITVKLKPNILMMTLFGKIFNYVEKIEFEEMLKVDFVNALEIAMVKFYMKNDYSPKDIKLKLSMKILDVIKQKGNEYTSLVKLSYPKSLMKLFKFMDTEILWTKPMWIKKELFIFSCFGEERVLKRFLFGMKTMGKVQSVSYKRANYDGRNSLSILTEKQQKILLKAKEVGDYKYPRKMDANKLSKELGISKQTLIEHLRKTENKIMDHILE